MLSTRIPLSTKSRIPRYVRAIDPFSAKVCATGPIFCLLDERDRMKILCEPLKSISNLAKEVTIQNCLPSFFHEGRIPQIGQDEASETECPTKATNRRSTHNLQNRPTKSA